MSGCADRVPGDWLVGALRVTVWHRVGGTSPFGSILTILTVLSWICAGIHICGALPCPVCA